MRSAPAPAFAVIGVGRLYPGRACRALLALPQDGLRLQPVHQIVGHVEGGTAMGRCCAGEHDRIPRRDLAAAMDDADVADFEPPGGGVRYVLERSPGECRM